MMTLQYTNTLHHTCHFTLHITVRMLHNTTRYITYYIRQISPIHSFSQNFLYATKIEILTCKTELFNLVKLVVIANTLIWLVGEQDLHLREQRMFETQFHFFYSFFLLE